MAPAGLAKVKTAKKDGSWNALDGSEALEIPPDLAEAFSKNKTAKEYFDAFPRSVKRTILERISLAAIIARMKIERLDIIKTCEIQGLLSRVRRCNEMLLTG